MKRITSFVLVLLLLLNLWGCGSNSDSDSENMDAIVDAYKDSAEIFLDKGDIEGAIDVLRKAVRETDDEELEEMLKEARELLKEQEEATEETDPPAETTVPVEIVPNVSVALTRGESKIPQIELPYDSIATLNQEIYDKLLFRLDSGYLTSYEWYINDDILSLVTFVDGSNTQACSVYNVSISTGESLDKASVLAVAGMTEKDYNSLAAENLEYLYVSENIDHKADPQYDSKLAENISDDNIKETQVYFGENGKIFFVAQYSTFGGTSLYDTAVELLTDVPEPDYIGETATPAGYDLTVDFTSNQWYKINIFLSNFSEQSIQTLDRGDSYGLVRFAYLYNLINNSDALLYDYSFNQYIMDEDLVNQTLERFIGQTVSHGTKTKQYGNYEETILYSGGSYYFPAAGGEFRGYVTIVDEMYYQGGDEYYVSFDVYSVDWDIYNNYGVSSDYYYMTKYDAPNCYDLSYSYSGEAIVRSYGEDSYQLIEYSAD